MLIGIDVGGTHIRIASFKSPDSPAIEKKVKFNSTNDYQIDLVAIKDNISKITTGKVDGIGIGVPGVLNEDKSQLKFASNLQGWNGKEIKKDLEETFRCKVLLENDATAGAIGEATFGHGIDKDFLFITWGTGIGGTFIERIDGKIYSEASELGHQIIERDGVLHYCGEKGCLEAYCSGRGIEDIYHKKAESLTDKEWNEVEKRFTQGLVNIIAIHPAKLVIFAGAVALNQETRIINIQNLLNNSLKIVPVPELKLSKLGDEVGLFGAFSLLKIR